MILVPKIISGRAFHLLKWEIVFFSGIMADIGLTFPFRVEKGSQVMLESNIKHIYEMILLSIRSKSWLNSQYISLCCFWWLHCLTPECSFSRSLITSSNENLNLLNYGWLEKFHCRRRRVIQRIHFQTAYQ